MLASRAYSNITISAPLGTSQHGRLDLLCFPARWTAVLAFVLANYVTHAFTIWKRPGEKTTEYLFACFLAFLFPVSGLGRGLDAMYRHAVWGRSPMELFKGLIGCGGVDYEVMKAARAGALGIVVREHSQEDDLVLSGGSGRFEYNDRHWDLPGAILRGTRRRCSNNDVGNPLSRTHPGDGTAVIKVKSHGDNPDNLLIDRNIAGYIKMHESSSYSIMELPASLGKDVSTQSADGNTTVGSQLVLPESSSIAPVFIALIQVLYATHGLVKNAGNQFERYGFASFSLSVIPYISMSIINLVGNLLTPTYTSITLIQTSTMREAVSRGNIILGSVGEIHDDDLLQEQDTLVTLANTCELSGFQQRQEFIVTAHSCPRLESPEREDCQQETPEANIRTPSPILINICFKKGCNNHSWEILIPSGRPPPQAQIYSRQGIFKLLGLTCAILPYILCMALVPPTHTPPVSSTKRAIVISWTTVDFLAGLYLLWCRKSLFESFTDLKFSFKAAARRFPGHPPKSEWESGDRKEEEYLAGEFWYILLFLFCLVSGLVVAGFYFYFVVDGLLEFGRCTSMSG